MKNNPDYVTLVNIKTGAHCRKRITIFNLWQKDPDGNTRGGGWAIADDGGKAKGEFTQAITDKLASVPTVVPAPVVKKNPVVSAEKEELPEPVEQTEETTETQEQDNPNEFPEQEEEPIPAPVTKPVAKKRPAAKRNTKKK